MTGASLTPPAPGAASLGGQARTWWRARTSRERQAIALVLLVLALFVAWSVLVQPALRTVREAPAQLDRLDAQIQQMQRIAAESGVLRAAPRVAPAQAGQALRAATDRLGDRGRLLLQGDRATVTFTGVAPEALRGWLIEARSGARARPVDAQLQRGPVGYSGTMIVTLGGAP
ncbi:MAG TPA: type II secretion system protein GspM [Burkholderiaceae bacterium]|nr:type II secretion system protein GspM [Burkholderiaceae bacterium]